MAVLSYLARANGGSYWLPLMGVGARRFLTSVRNRGRADTKNVMTRLEARWDHSLSGTGVWGGDATNVSDQKNAVVLIAQAIYKF